jgi:hypothetical protein
VYSGRLKVGTRRLTSLTEEQIRGAGARAWLSSRGEPVRPVDADTGEAATLGKLPDHVAFARTDLLILTYEWGVCRHVARGGDHGRCPLSRLHERRVTAIAKVARMRARNAASTTREEFPGGEEWLRAARHPVAAGVG